MDIQEQTSSFRRDFQAMQAELAKLIVGQHEVVEGTLTALMAGGHVLLEGVPGLGKTLLVRTLSQITDLRFSRIQFTPDLMPADITGTNLVSEDEAGRRAFQFQAGPVFANIILADEINRATPKTQSALLEAMQEHSVTVGGVARTLEEPVCVLATQNPIEMGGTYPLPEAQLDRFLLKLIVPSPRPQRWASSSTERPRKRRPPSSRYSMAGACSRCGHWCAGCPSQSTCATMQCGWCARRTPAATGRPTR